MLVLSRRHTAKSNSRLRHLGGSVRTLTNNLPRSAESFMLHLLGGSRVIVTPVRGNSYTVYKVHLPVNLIRAIHRTRSLRDHRVRAYPDYTHVLCRADSSTH